MSRIIINKIINPTTNNYINCILEECVKNKWKIPYKHITLDNSGNIIHVVITLNNTTCVLYGVDYEIEVV